jgi:hypothetical protein
MSKITLEMIKQSYIVAKNIYNEIIGLVEGAKDLNKNYNIAIASAKDFINNFRYMKNGKQYKRTMSGDATRYYLQNIFDDYGHDALQMALQAVDLHIKYYEELRHGQLDNIRKIYIDFKKIQKPENNHRYDLYVSENNIDKEIKNIEDRLEKINKTEKQSIIKSRIGQSNFKNGLVKKYKKCLLCDIGMLELLIASHIKPWSESNDMEKLDLNNGLLLCCIHDKLFDLGFISFDTSGIIIISNQIDESLYKNLRINKEQNIDVNAKTIKYLNWHKENKLRQKIG